MLKNTLPVIVTYCGDGSTSVLLLFEFVLPGVGGFGVFAPCSGGEFGVLGVDG